MLAHDCEANNTYEGDNDILLMQTAKMLLRNLQWMMKGKTVLETCEFMHLEDPDVDVLKRDLTPKNMLMLFRKRAKDQTMEFGQTISQNFADWDKHQAYMVRDMTKAYHELYLANTFKEFIAEFTDPATKKVFQSMADLYMKSKIVEDS